MYAMPCMPCVSMLCRLCYFALACTATALYVVCLYYCFVPAGTATCMGTAAALYIVHSVL